MFLESVTFGKVEGSESQRGEVGSWALQGTDGRRTKVLHGTRTGVLHGTEPKAEK